MQTASPAPAGTTGPLLPALEASAPHVDTREDPKLVSLRDELRTENTASVRAKLRHYLPLCDKDGYPLVGNVVRKSPKPELQPSELCALGRRRAP